MIQKPPSGTELDFAARARILKAPRQRGERQVPYGIEVEKHHFRERTFRIERVHPARKRRDARAVVYTVVAGVCAEYLIHPGIVVAHRADVYLHGETVCGTAAQHLPHHERLVRLRLRRGDLFAGQHAAERLGSLFARAGRVHLLQRYVRRNRTLFLELNDARRDRLFQLFKGRNVAVYGTQPAEILGIARIVYVHDFIRTERGQHAEGIIFLFYIVEHGQIVENFVRRADDLYVRAGNERRRRERVRLYVVVRLVPYFFRIGGADNVVYAEVVAQFHVRPMVQRVAVSSFQRADIAHEFFLVRSTARDIFFVYAEVAHQPPFVMIAAKPQLEKVVERFILLYRLFRKVAMIVENGHILRIAVIQFFRRLVGQQKILSDKFPHFSFLFYFFSRHSYKVTPRFQTAISRLLFFSALQVCPPAVFRRTSMSSSAAPSTPISKARLAS